MKLPAASERGIIMDYILSPQGAGNITHEILRLRSGSVRLINFVSQNQSLTDLITRLAVWNRLALVYKVGFVGILFFALCFRNYETF